MKLFSKQLIYIYVIKNILINLNSIYNFFPMISLYLISKDILIRWEYKTIKLLICFLIFSFVGCASRDLVPISDNGTVYPEFKAVRKTIDGVTVEVNSSPWRGSPNNLNRYITPFYMEIENNTERALNLSYDDIVLVDANRTQFNSLKPELVADIITTTSQGSYAYGPGYPRVSIGLGFGYYSGWSYYRRPFYGPFYTPFFIYGNYPVGYYPPSYYSPPQVGDVFTKALIPGKLNPKSKLKGYVYFQKLPKEVKQVSLDVSYKFEGEQERQVLRFPFAFE